VEILQHAVRAAAASGDADAVATAAEFAVPGDIDDDMAILVVRSWPTELAATERAFPAEPIMVSEARRLAAQTFGSWGMDPEQTELACLLVSEVATNAVLHASAGPAVGRDPDFDLGPVIEPAAGPGPDPGRTPEPVPARPGGPAAPAWASAGPAGGAAVPVQAAVRPAQGTAPPGWADAPPGADDAVGPEPRADPQAQPNALRSPAPDAREGKGPAREFTLRLRRGANAVWVEVFDTDLRLPRIRTATETDEGGRGLYLVEQLATRWGSRPTPEGKAVWFEVPRSASRS
jgi:hypothetical protein